MNSYKTQILKNLSVVLVVLIFEARFYVAKAGLELIMRVKVTLALSSSCQVWATTPGLCDAGCEAQGPVQTFTNWAVLQSQSRQPWAEWTKPGSLHGGSLSKKCSLQFGAFEHSVPVGEGIVWKDLGGVALLEDAWLWGWGRGALRTSILAYDSFPSLAVVRGVSAQQPAPVPCPSPSASLPQHERLLTLRNFKLKNFLL